VKVHEEAHPENKNIIFVDTPGLNDINQARSILAMKEVKDADVVLYFLNAEGGVVGKNELDSLNKISKRDEKVSIVINKIDVIIEEDLIEIIRYVRKETKDRFQLVAVSAKTGENMTELNELILDFLSENGKDILFARSKKMKALSAHKWIT